MSSYYNRLSLLESSDDEDMYLYQEQTDTSCDCNAMSVSVQAISQELKTLHLQIQSIKRQLKSCECLEETCDTMKEEEKAAKKMCVNLRRQAKVLSDKVQRHGKIHAMYEKTKASNEAMDLRRQSLQQSVEDLKTKLNSFNEEKVKYEAERQKAEEQMKVIQDLQKQQEELTLEKEAMTRQNEALKQKIQELQKEKIANNSNHQVTLKEEHLTCLGQGQHSQNDRPETSSSSSPLQQLAAALRRPFMYMGMLARSPRHSEL